MGYDDGFYYGQCKLICLAESAADNGKTVSVSNGDRSWSGTVSNQKCEFLVPNRTQYAVELIDGDDTDWAGTIEAGYGECILVHLADGYEAIVEKKKLTLDEIAASVGSVADYVPDADAVKTLNTNLVKKISDAEYATPYVTVDGIGYDETNKKLMLKVNGADTVIPFNGGIDVTKFKYVNGTQNSHTNFNFTADGEIILVIFFTKYNGNTTSYTLSLYDIVNNKYCSNTNTLTDGLGNLTVSGNSGYLYNSGNFNQNVWGFIFYR